MSKIVSKEEVLENLDFYVEEIEKGKIFIYPTDTILGIGCDASNNDSIKKLKEIKKRDPKKPNSIIVPNFGWIEENCLLSTENFEFIREKLPGPYTFIIFLKNENIISNEVNPMSKTVGIRIPNNWFNEVVRKTKKPFVTTSVNISGENIAEKLAEIDDSIRNQVDYIICEEGWKSSKPSTIIDLTKDSPEIIERNPPKED